MEFKNETTAQFVAWAEAAKIEFTGRRKGAEYRAIVLTICNCFPEDRDAILSAIFQKIEPEQQAAPNLNRPSPARKQTAGGCEDCPNSPGIEYTAGKIKPRTIETGLSFSSPQDVLSRFESDPAMMQIFASKQRINIGNASKPEKLAEIIFNHFKEGNK